MSLADFLDDAVGAAFGGFVAALIALFGKEWFEHYRRARLLVKAGTEGCRVDTPIRIPQNGQPSEHRARYIRLYVSNAGSRTAKNCRAYLWSFWKIDENGQRKGILTADPIELNWSYYNDAVPIDIPPGFARYVDVFWASSATDMLLMGSNQIPHTTERARQSPGRFGAAVRITSDGADIGQACLEVSWDGQWNGLDFVDQSSTFWGRGLVAKGSRVGDSTPKVII